MKIRPEHLEALKQEQQARKPSPREESSFEKVLNGELGHTEKTAVPCRSHPQPPLAGLGGLDPLTLSSLEVTPTRQNVMQALDSVLSRWDEYRDSLRSDHPDLKKAYRVLETISTDVRTLKESDMTEGAGSRFAPLLDELEILTVTERIKFNRGDYV